LAECIGVRLGQKTHPSEVHSEHRHAGRPGHLRRTQQSAVPAEDEHQLDTVGRVLVGPHHGARKRRTCDGDRVVGRGAEQPHGEPGGGEPLPDLARRVQRLLPVGVHHQEDFTAHAGPFSTAERTRSAILARSSWSSAAILSPACRSHAKYSTLPAGPGNGLATTPCVISPRSAATVSTPSTASARSPRSRTTPPLPTLSL